MSATNGRSRARNGDILRLMAILLDEYGPEEIGMTSISRVYRGAPRIAAKTKRVDCRKCKYLIDPDCDTCNGKGTVLVDFYTAEHDSTGHGLQAPLQERQTMKPHEIDLVLAQQQEQIPDSLPSPLATKIALRERRRTSNSHRSVRLAVEAMREARYDDYNHIINRCISNGVTPALTPRNRAAFRWLLRRVPAPIRAHPAATVHHKGVRGKGRAA